MAWKTVQWNQLTEDRIKPSSRREHAYIWNFLNLILRKAAFEGAKWLSLSVYLLDNCPKREDNWFILAFYSGDLEDNSKWNY